MDPVIVRVYVIAVVAGILVAFLLVKLSKSSAVASKNRPDGTHINMAEDPDVARMIYGTVSNIITSERISKEITKDLTGVFSRELDKKMKSNLDFVEKKYQPFIKDAEVAWSKYKNTLVSQRKVEAVMHSIASGYIVLDAKGKIVMANPAAEEILGFPKGKIIDSFISSIPAEGRSVALLGNNNKAMRVDMISRDEGAKDLLRASNAIIEDCDGQTIGVASILNNITKQKNLDKMKKDFISNVTHELRTPLIAAEKAINLLQDVDGVQTPPEVQKEYLSMAERNLKRLGMLIDDLLDFSKIESGMAQFKPSVVSMEKIINDSIQDIQAWVLSKSITIEKRLQENMPEANMDAKKISQVLNNLIGNAVKFTPRNGVITIKAELKQESKKIEVSVEDTGAGIEDEEIGRIFDRFYQSSERAPVDIVGTGIGLSLAKENVELHGGRIWAENKKDIGARFTFELPLALQH